MFGLGIWEIAVIAIVALLFVGPDKLPEAAKKISAGIRDFRKQTRELTKNIEDDTEFGAAVRDLKSALRGDDLREVYQPPHLRKTKATVPEGADGVPGEPTVGEAAEADAVRVAAREAARVTSEASKEVLSGPLEPSVAVAASSVDGGSRAEPVADPGPAGDTRDLDDGLPLLVTPSDSVAKTDPRRPSSEPAVASDVPATEADKVHG